MSTAPASITDRWQKPGVSHYAVIGLVSLGVVFLVLAQRDLGVWALAPVLAGLIGGIMRFGPVLFLLVLAVISNMLPYFADRPSRGALWNIPDLLLCGAVLAYVIAHYRLQGMLWHIFPPDSRRRESAAGRGVWARLRRKPRPIQSRRSPQLVSPQEIGTMILALPIFAALTQIIWNGVPFERRNPELQPPIWHGIVLCWFIGLGWFIVTGILGYIQLRRLTAEQATLYLQDILWAETRREQRRLNRWLAWSRLRQQRREDHA